MIVSVVGAAPAGAAKFGRLRTPAKFGRVHVGAYRIRPPTAGGAGKRAGAHCEKAMQALRDHLIHYEKAVQVLRGRSAHCDEAVQGLHGRFTHCDDAVQVLHGRFAHCDDAAQVLHGRFAHCDGAAQVLHDRFAHCGEARNGTYAIRPYPGTRHSCTRPNSQASVDAPANFAGVRRRP